MERLTYKITNIQTGNVLSYGLNSGFDMVKAIQKLGAYEDAEEQGLLLRLPCKVGDKVYTTCAWGIESGVVGSIEMISDRVFVNNEHGSMIGEARNIYLTKEEAEQALKQMGE